MEIPLHATFEIHFHISGWNDKWIYLTGAFISFPKSHKHLHGGKGGSNSKSDNLVHSAKNADPPAITISESVVIAPPITEVGASETNSAIPSGVATPAERSTTSLFYSLGETSITYDNIKPVPVPEGATLHAISVSQYCYKHGRVTVPPRVALVLSGFGKPERARERWDKLLAMRDDKRKIRDLMRGGWKSDDGGGLGASFWDFEFEEEGQKRGQEIKRARLVMDILARK